AAVNQEDLIGEDTCTVTVAGGTEVQAGTHRATAASLSSQNYALPEENTCQYIIAPKVVTLTWSGNETRTYDGEPSNVTAAVNQEDLVGEDTCTVEVAGGSEINAGTYEAEAASLSNENYALPGEKTCQYVIEPKEVTLTWSGNETRTYDKKKSSVTAKAEGLVKEDVCNVTVTGGEAVNAGTHTATAESLDNDNYVLPAEKTCAYTIQKKEVTLIWSGDTARIYDGTPSAVTAKTDGIEEGDLCEVSSVTGGTEVKAGTHEAQAEGLQGTDSGNYRLPENASHKYTIEPKEVTLKWSGTEDRIYNGQKSQVEAALEGLVGDDICTVASVTGSDEIHAGAHTARVESLEGADSGNYRLPEDPTCTYNILPKEITVSWSGNADRIYDGTASMVAASPVGLVAGDACAVTVTGGNGVNAGTHTATAAALDNGDYALSGEVTCAYTIRPKEITVSWSGNADRIYDGTASAVAASPVGLVAGDACTVAVTGGNGVNAGTHTATTAGLDNGNYVLAAQASCTYTIQPREAVLSWSGNGERIYDGAASNVAATVANLAAGDICGVTVTGGNEVNAGTHTATAVGLDNGNYILPAQASCAYTIGKAEQSLTVAKTSYTQAVKKAFMLGVSASGEVTYTSSNSKIAKVDASGKVTPLRSGKAVITVEAKETENYKGAAREIEIYVRPANVASFKAKAGKRKITLKWKKQAGVSGYQIQYSTSKKFTKKTTKTVNVKASAKKYTLKKLASKKRYYVRIRAYKTINRVKYYSPKFRTKKVKVK
ncbi:MAG: fibronectin type III domain-containing protein, partial [Eubacteriales bacterium]|nr:fibronectin type III domain-containing protein [Eubacteriales bacterium]